MNLSEAGSEAINWEADGIYQLEVTDPVQGGPGGTANLQAAALAKRTRNLHDRTAKVESNLGDVAQGSTVLDVIRGGIVAEMNTLEKLRAGLMLVINSLETGGVTAEQIYATIRGGVDEAHDTLQELLDTINNLQMTYAKIDTTLKAKVAVNAAIDLSAAGIGTITLSANTAFNFSGFQVNKNYLLIINANGFLPSFAVPSKHAIPTGGASFTNAGTYYVSLTCIDATQGAEKLLTIIMK